MTKARWAEAKEQFPSCTMGMPGWLTFFDSPAGQQAIGAILGDIYAEIVAGQDRIAGVRRMGRRPKPPRASLDEVYAAVFPERFTMDPLPVALEKLLSGRALRSFAVDVPCHHSTLSRILSGQMVADITMIERIAGAAQVQPAYFAEWRAMYVGQLITKTLLARPNLGIKAIKTLERGPQTVRMGS